MTLEEFFLVPLLRFKLAFIIDLVAQTLTQQGLTSEPKCLLSFGAVAFMAPLTRCCTFSHNTVPHCPKTLN